MYYIYGLFDPRTGHLRYIGLSQYPEKRLKGHLGINTENKRKREWIKELNNKWLEPILRTLDSSRFSDDAAEMEMFYIGYFRMLGADLLNSKSINRTLVYT